jgi:hypothetical protein
MIRNELRFDFSDPSQPTLGGLIVIDSPESKLLQPGLALPMPVTLMIVFLRTPVRMWVVGVSGDGFGSLCVVAKI